MEEREILECISACGFREELGEKYLVCAREGRKKEQLCLLCQQRRQLMEELHTAQRRVDNIDYIIHCLEKTEREEADHGKHH